MDYSGLAYQYKVNRPLTDEERAQQLKQDKKLDVEPLHQLAVIRMNSTYLEMVDKYYAWKGFLSTVSLCFAGMVLWFAVYALISLPHLLQTVYVDRKSEFLISEIIWLSILTIFFIVFIWLLRKESFRYTHYPIRLDRKTRIVHVFRLNGTVLSVPWKQVFFTIGQAQSRGWGDIRGHVLDADGVSVKETFAFSHYSGKNDPDLMQFWEFIRRYMEQGPASLIDQVEHIMPISGRHETFWHGFHRLLAEFAPVPLIAILTSPLWFVVAIFRFIAMRTSKIPHWPKEVEESGIVDPNDPYQRDEQHFHPNNAKGMSKQRIAA